MLATPAVISSTTPIMQRSHWKPVLSSSPPIATSHASPHYAGVTRSHNCTHPHHQQPHQTHQRQGAKEHVPQNLAFSPLLSRRDNLPQSAAMFTTECRMKSNFPVSTVMLYTNFAFSTIHLMGNNPYNAPSPAAASASFVGMLNTRIARPSAGANPATAATGARTCQTRRSAQHHNGKGGDQHGNTPVPSTETR